jgi:hypothetical protein
MESAINYLPLGILSAKQSAAVVRAMDQKDNVVVCKLSRAEDDELDILRKINGKHHNIQLLDIFPHVEISFYKQVMVFSYYHKNSAPQLLKKLFEVINCSM